MAKGKSETTYDVFISYDHRDFRIAEEIAEVLRSYGLTVFLDSSQVETGSRIEDVIWEAMAESHALVAVISDDATWSSRAFELGAAKAWNKPIYCVASGPTFPNPPAALQDAAILPLSRIGEVAQSIVQSTTPISDADKQHLADAYQKIGISADQLALQPQQLAKLVRLFNRKSRRRMSGEQVLWLLLRLRKSKALPQVGRRPPTRES